MAKKEISFRKMYNHDVRKANPIATSAAFDYSLIEEKMVDYVSTIVPAPKVNSNGEIKYPLVYVIYYSHFCKCTGKQMSTSYYNSIDKSLEGLRDKSIKLILSDQRTTLISFLERVEFNTDNNTDKKSRKAIIKLDDRIIPILIEKKKNYFEHHPEYTMLMDSKYSIRLYQWLLALYNKEIGIKKAKTKFQNGQFMKDVNMNNLESEDRRLYYKQLAAIEHGQREYYIHIDVLRDQLNISKTYRGFETIKTKILEPAIDEINKKTDLYINKSTLTINDDNYICFTVKRKDELEMCNTESLLKELINNISIRPNEVSHVMENEEEYEVEQYTLIEKWAETM